MSNSSPGLPIALCLFEATETLAPLAYATLPATIGLFVWRYDWEGPAPAEPA